MLQIGNSENADWFARCMPMCEVRLFQSEVMAKYQIMVLACQVGLFHLKLTQINSEMNRIAKHKFTDESQELDTRRSGKNLNIKVKLAS